MQFRLEQHRCLFMNQILIEASLCLRLWTVVSTNSAPHELLANITDSMEQ